MNENSIRILLADDHTILRSGLRRLLEEQSQFQIVGEASSGLETLSLTEELKPDLILLDLSMPGLGGLEAIPVIKKVAPATRILVLTMHEDPQYLRRALLSGVSGYVLKKAADVELIMAIQAVMRGEIYVHPAMTRFLVEDLIPGGAMEADKDQWSELSRREQEVLQKVALGYTSSEIATQLNLSAKTVETYRARGMEKLELGSRAALVRYTLQKGLITGE